MNAQDTQLDSVPMLVPDAQEEELIFVQPGGGAQPEGKDKPRPLQAKECVGLAVGTASHVQEQWGELGIRRAHWSGSLI